MTFQLARHPAKRSARYRRGDGRDPCFVPADPGVDDRSTSCLNGFRQLDGFVKRAAIFHQVEHRQAKDNNKVVTGTLANGPYHLDGKSHAVGVIAAPLVSPLVGAQGEKFVDQIAFRAHDLYAVVACFPRQLCAMGKILNQLQHFIVGQLMRGKAVDRRLNSGGRDEVRLIAITSGMQNLQRDFAAFVMHRVGNYAVMW